MTDADYLFKTHIPDSGDVSKRITTAVWCVMAASPAASAQLLIVRVKVKSNVMIVGKFRLLLKNCHIEERKQYHKGLSEC